jgi:hypothetical protein
MDPVELNRLAGTLWLVLAASAGLGVATMAVVQLVKDLFPMREMWQRRWVQSRAREQARRAGAAQAPAAGPDPMTDLIRQATGGDAKALYALPVERLAGQLNAAAQVVLDYPTRHQPLLHVLAAGADPDDLATLLSAPPRRAPGVRDEETTRFVDARNRVAHHVQRNLDALQISTTFRWQLWLQIVSLAVSVVLAAFASAILFPWEEGAVWWSKVILVGVLGGFFAGVARDLAAALENLRGRSR